MHILKLLLIIFTVQKAMGGMGKDVRYIFQEQPSRGVLRKRCSEKMQQMYRRTTMSKCFATLLKSHFGRGVLL